jgi:hypothetical protein
MSDQLIVMNRWLAILTTISVIEFAMIVLIAIVGLRWYRRAAAAANRLESEYIMPLTAKLNTAVAQVHDVTTRVQRADEKVRAVAERVGEVGSRVATVAQQAWPVIGLWRAVGAAVGVLIHNSHRRRSVTGRRPAQAIAPPEIGQSTVEPLDSSRVFNRRRA